MESVPENGLHLQPQSPAQDSPGFPGPWVTFLDSLERLCQLPKLCYSQTGSETRGTGFSDPCCVGMGPAGGSGLWTVCF